MPLINCPECGKHITRKTDRCPRCGYSFRRNHLYIHDNKQRGCLNQTLSSGCVAGIIVLVIVVIIFLLTKL